MKKTIQKIMSRILQVFSYLFPVKRNSVVMNSFTFKYDDSPKYLCEYILKNCDDKFEISYVTKYKQTADFLKSKGIKPVKMKSPSFFAAMFRAKFIIVNQSFPYYMPKKKNQIVIYTNHGIDIFKRLIDNVQDHPEDFTMVNKVLSACEMDSENGKHKYGVDDDRILRCGFPRLSPFFDKDYKCPTNIKEKLNIPKNKKIILYGPTFRADHKKKDLTEDLLRIIDCCEKKFGGEFVLLNRDHNFTLLKEKGKSYHQDKIFECNVIEDMQELIYSSDVLISDYSSWIWDASFAKAPCFIYAYDIEEYYKTWAFYYPIEKWPFPVAYNIEEMENNILNFDNTKYRQSLKDFHKTVGNYENGTACEKVTDYMLSKTN